MTSCPDVLDLPPCPSDGRWAVYVRAGSHDARGRAQRLDVERERLLAHLATLDAAAGPPRVLVERGRGHEALGLMRGLVRAGALDAVLVARVDRLGEDRGAVEEMLALCESTGTHVACADGTDVGDPVLREVWFSYLSEVSAKHSAAARRGWVARKDSAA